MKKVIIECLYCGFKWKRPALKVGGCTNCGETKNIKIIPLIDTYPNNEQKKEEELPQFDKIVDSYFQCSLY